MAPDQRDAVENLLLLCPNHHREIDRLRPQDWPSERLMEVKSAHEAHCRTKSWASEALLEFYASMVASDLGQESPSPSNRPRLVIERGVKRGDSDPIDVVNVGTGDAFKIRIDVAARSPRDNIMDLTDFVLPRMSPGGRWPVGRFYFRRTQTCILRATYTDVDGTPYEGEFPV